MIEKTVEMLTVFFILILLNCRPLITECNQKYALYSLVTPY